MPVMPAYQRVMEDIKSKISSGEWPPGQPLPTPGALAATYTAAWGLSVSGPTVRRATDTLQMLGWLVGRQGVAVSVAENPPIGGQV
jgi:GntR family transcriptional regulator